MTRTKKPRSDIWSGRPYGTYEGPRGTEDEWAAAFRETWEETTAQRIIGDDPETPWAILGVAQGSDWGKVRKAFLQLIRRWHPDVCKEPGAEEMCKRVVAAYATLEKWFGKDRS
jgi:hypothetical protein